MSASEPDWEFHFETGRQCLDFVATIGDRAHLAFDRWRTPEDFSRWCMDAGLLSAALTVPAQRLKEACSLRESIYRAIVAGRDGARPKRQDVQMINDWAARPSLAPQLGERSGRITWISDAPVEAVLSTMARDAIDLIGSDDIGRVRECASPSCSVLFLDTSRPGKRTWCSMSRCGNRSKKATYRRRLHEA